MHKHFGKLKFLLLFLFIFSIFYSITASRPEEVVVIEYTGDGEKTIDNLYTAGFINNKLSYYTVHFLNKFYKPIRPGGYSLKKGMGALAIHAELTNPDYKYVTFDAGLRKEEVADILAEDLGWPEDKKIVS